MVQWEEVLKSITRWKFKHVNRHCNYSRVDYNCSGKEDWRLLALCGVDLQRVA